MQKNNEIHKVFTIIDICYIIISQQLSMTLWCNIENSLTKRNFLKLVIFWSVQKPSLECILKNVKTISSLKNLRATKEQLKLG